MVTWLMHWLTIRAMRKTQEGKHILKGDARINKKSTAYAIASQKKLLNCYNRLIANHSAHAKCQSPQITNSDQCHFLSMLQFDLKEMSSSGLTNDE